jgi:hypothetical protein
MTTTFMKPREPFLDIASFKSMLAFREARAIPQAEQALSIGDIDSEDVGHVVRRLFKHRFDATMLAYSGGMSFSEVAARLVAAIDSFDRMLSCEEVPLTYVDLSVQDHYVEALWLLSLTKLLGLGDDEVQRVADFYAADESNDGADELFELLLAKLGRKSFPAEGVIHEDPYQLLLDCVQGDPTDRPALMTQFLKRWFKGQKECDWWGSHIPRKGTTVLDTGFFGYWAFEAALVTYLWDIDDSTYRDLPHYPKDLVEHARSTLGRASLDGNGQRLRCEANQPCPREGFWFTPARAGSRRFFKAGEVMPEIGGDYGATVWQWDENQTAPRA